MNDSEACTESSAIYSVQAYQGENSLGFLLNRCLNRITDAADRALAELGINIQQFGVLHAIYRGRASNPSAMARLRFQNSAAITYTLDLLEKKNLLVRKRSIEDRRVVDLELTEEGKALTEAGIPRAVAAQNRILQSLSQADYQTLHILLGQIADQEAT